MNRDVPLDVLLVRHAIAEEQDFSRWPDDGDRPLTREGIRRFEPVARRLGVLVPEVDRLLTSPLRRARQTADILARETAWPPAVDEAALAGGADPFGAIDLLRELHGGASRCVVLVGAATPRHRQL
jgi:phosphohistidine phosphatase